MGEGSCDVAVAAAEAGRPPPRPQLNGNGERASPPGGTDNTHNVIFKAEGVEDVPEDRPEEGVEVAENGATPKPKAEGEHEAQEHPPAEEGIASTGELPKEKGGERNSGVQNAPSPEAEEGEGNADAALAAATPSPGEGVEKLDVVPGADAAGSEADINVRPPQCQAPAQVENAGTGSAIKGGIEQSAMEIKQEVVGGEHLRQESNTEWSENTTDDTRGLGESNACTAAVIESVGVGETNENNGGHGAADSAELHAPSQHTPPQYPPPQYPPPPPPPGLGYEPYPPPPPGAGYPGYYPYPPPHAWPAPPPHYDYPPPPAQEENEKEKASAPHVYPPPPHHYGYPPLPAGEEREKEQAPESHAYPPPPPPYGYPPLAPPGYYPPPPGYYLPPGPPLAPGTEPHPGGVIHGGPPPPIAARVRRTRIRTPQDVLVRKERKNAQSRSRAARLRERVENIRIKGEGAQTEEEARLCRRVEERRERKNDRSRDRALEKKAELERIAAKPEATRTPEEVQTWEVAAAAKRRKNEGDRLRRERLKKMGLKAKPPGVSVRGRPREPPRREEHLAPLPYGGGGRAPQQGLPPLPQYPSYSMPHAYLPSHTYYNEPPRMEQETNGRESEGNIDKGQTSFEGEGPESANVQQEVPGL